MQRVSVHISYKEATRSNTAIKNAISNEPDSIAWSKMQTLAAEVFEPVRLFYAHPIRVNSFYRSPELNAIIGGSTTSQHCKGEAIDIDADSDNHILFDWIIENLNFDQLIWEFGNDNNPDWIHVSYSDNNRKQVLKAVRVNGKTKYFPYE